MTSKQRRSLTAVQRAMVLYMCKPPRRPSEKCVAQRCSRGKWGGELQRHRFFMFMGHRQATLILSYRSNNSFVEGLGMVNKVREGVTQKATRTTRPTSPTSRPTSPTSRPAVANRARAHERVLKPGQHKAFPKVQQQIRNEMQQEPKTWRIFAQCREVYRAFSRWCSFKRKL